MERIKKLAENYFEQVVSLRHLFHQFPELSGKESATADKITEVLDSLKIPYKKNVAGFGIVALLKGEGSGKGCVALRADMDALPIQEVNDTAYCSQNAEVMHACGHDAHIASLLGALMILNDLKPDFGGSVKAIFQPSEEEYGGGADVMIAEGVLANPKTTVILGQHVTPELKSGSIGLKAGAYMASTDEIHIKIIGKGGHAALSDHLVNPIMVGIKLLEAIDAIVSVLKPKDTPSVVAFGKFISQGKCNIVNDVAEIEGTIRTFDEKWRTKVHELIISTALRIAKSTNAIIEVDIRHGYPVLTNDDKVTQRIKKYAQQYLGKEQIMDLPLRMTADDFAYFLQKIPGCYYRLGVGSPTDTDVRNLHTSAFDIDDSSLKTGMGLMSWIAIQELAQR